MSYDGTSTDATVSIIKRLTVPHLIIVAHLVHSLSLRQLCVIGQQKLPGSEAFCPNLLISGFGTRFDRGRVKRGGSSAIIGLNDRGDSGVGFVIVAARVGRSILRK